MTQVSVTGFTAARSQAIEDEAIVSGLVNSSGHLILTKNNGSTIDAGSVITAAVNGIRICTSSTRPAAVKGLGIFQTDTNEFLIYDGFRWNPPWNSKWGQVGSPLIADGPGTNQSISNPTETSLTNLAVDFNPIANRRYIHKLTILAQNDITGGEAASVLKLCNVSNTEIYRWVLRHAKTINLEDSRTFEWTERGLPTAVGVTRKVRLLPSAGTTAVLNANAKSQYYIMDDGPDGNPAA